MPYSIYIARQFGSGGRAIGKLLAKKLNYHFFDSKLVDLAAEKGNLSYESANAADEKSLNPWLYTSTYSNVQYNTGHSDPERLYKLQSEIIREKAEKENCIFVGRCADAVLEDIPDIKLLSLYICAPLDWRIKRLMRTEGFGSEKETIAAMRKKDRQRKNYYNYYTGREYTDPSNYDLCLNSAYLGIERSTDFLKTYVSYVFN